MSVSVPPLIADDTVFEALSARFRSDEFLFSIINSMSDAMLLLDDAGRILFCSPAGEALLGQDARALIGRDVLAVLHLPDGATAACGLPGLLAFGGIAVGWVAAGGARPPGRRTRMMARHRSGTRFPVDLTMAPTMVEGRAMFAVLMHDRREIEDGEHRLNVLRAELAQVSRISSMGMLASAIAHEVNQPLSAIANYAETIEAMLAEGQLDHTTIETAMRHCTQEAMRASEVIRRLRGFLARGEVERARCSLSALIGDALALALIDGEGAGVTVTCDYDAASDTVFADRVQVQQVVLNLLRNALEAMGAQAQRMIAVRTGRREDGMVEIVVADSGPGIEPHIAQRLFQPLLSTKASGMGIGLSICHTIVDGHGGKIWAEPSSLGGTAFHFTLPLLRADEA
jgi:two-component system sensor kinase FixL